MKNKNENNKKQKTYKKGIKMAIRARNLESS